MAAERDDGSRGGRVNGMRGPAAVLPNIVREAKSADDKLVGLVRERPIIAICAAMAVGYMIGRVFTRMD